MPTLSIVIPCYNESATLERCLERVEAIASEALQLDIVIVDDCSKDDSLQIAENLAKKWGNIRVERHVVNQGKGAALRTGFACCRGNFIAVQDADLEYNPAELPKLLEPLLSGDADVVIGSRFLSGNARRVLYFWHAVTNKILTLMSNMFTDLNLSDMESCYKVMRREIVEKITLEENRFGIEPELVAKIAALKPRIYEMGISYYGRTYEEGKKIGWKDGVRALYCILRYAAPGASTFVQFLLYLFVGGTAGLINLGCFLILLNHFSTVTSAIVAYGVAAAVNYLLCVLLLFRRGARWKAPVELGLYLAVVLVGGLLDILALQFFLHLFPAGFAKVMATALLLVFNFAMRKWLIFHHIPDKNFLIPDRKPVSSI